MDKSVKCVSAWLMAALGLVEMPSAHALQIVEGSDGVTVEAILSIKEPTRIRIEGASITNVFGNIYSSNCGAASLPPPGAPAAPPAPQVNPAGELVLECDSEKGEIYVRPVGEAGKPVNLFISSPVATYTLLLRRSDTPADTIVIRDKTVRPSQSASAGSPPASRQSQHVRSLKAMLVAMASDRLPVDIRVEEVRRTIQLWAGVDFALTRLYEGRGLVGERYSLTNTSNDTIVLAEQEFDREAGGVLGVSIEHHNLRPGDSTVVYVVRRGA
jgi:conjugal transfer pilus assembly protein TraK